MRGGAIMPSRDKLGRATGNFLTKVHPDTWRSPPASQSCREKGANTQNRTKIERERPREKEGKIVKNQPLVSPKCRERFLCNTFTFCPTRLARSLTTYHLPARIEKATEKAKRLHWDSLPVKVPLALKPNRAIALTASKLLSARRLCATAAAAQSRQHHYNPTALLRSDFELSSKWYVYSSHWQRCLGIVSIKQAACMCACVFRPGVKLSYWCAAESVLSDRANGITTERR